MFKIGDTVALKSGSRMMRVVQVEGDKVLCEWRERAGGSKSKPKLLSQEFRADDVEKKRRTAISTGFK